MTKTKKPSIHAPLVIMGYILFALLIVSVLLSTTIPFGKLLFDPRVLHYNVAVTTIALTVGSFLPVLVGYLVGDSSIKSKSTLSHHFNGVLFGLLSFWLMTLFAVVISVPQLFSHDLIARMVVVNILPSVGVAIATIILAVAHVRGKQAQHDIVEYKPFVWFLVGVILVLPVWSVVNNIITQSVSVYTFVSVAAIAVIGGISYATLHRTKLSRQSKITWSAVSVSVLYAALFVSTLLVSGITNFYLDLRTTMEQQMLLSLCEFVLALIGWVVYWTVQVKALSAHTGRHGKK